MESKDNIVPKPGSTMNSRAKMMKINSLLDVPTGDPIEANQLPRRGTQ